MDAGSQGSTRRLRTDSGVPKASRSGGRPCVAPRLCLHVFLLLALYFLKNNSDRRLFPEQSSRRTERSPALSLTTPGALLLRLVVGLIMLSLFRQV